VWPRRTWSTTYNSGNPGVLAYLNLVNDIPNKNAVGTAIDTLSIANSMGWMAVPGIQVIAVAYSVFNLVSDLFGGGDDSVPDPWGNGRYVWNGYGVGVSAEGQTGGDQAGEKVSIVPQGILLQSSAGQTSLLVTRVDDLTVIEANSGGVEAVNEHLYFCEKMAA